MTKKNRNPLGNSMKHRAKNKGLLYISPNSPLNSIAASISNHSGLVVIRLNLTETANELYCVCVIQLANLLDSKVGLAIERI